MSKTKNFPVDSAPLRPAPVLFSSLSLAVLVGAVLTLCLPALMAFSVSPSATFLNQATAVVGWGVFCALLAPTLSRLERLELTHGLHALLAALGIMAAAAVVSMLRKGALPGTIGLSAVAMILAAMAVAFIGAVSQRGQSADLAFGAFCLALVCAGTASLVLAIVQYFAPEWADGEWIARMTTPGRAGANLRQPNHLSSLLLWSLVALLWWHEARAKAERPSIRTERILFALLWAGLVFGDVLTVSRTGTVCVVLLAVWGIVDRRLSPFGRRLLWATPLLYAIAWFGVSEWAQAGAHVFAGDSQLHRSDLSSSRFGIWSNTLSLIASHPLAGVGWGEFNFAWSLTPFPDRPVAFFDHTHNLPLQLLVELGIPLGLLVMALLLWALWKALHAVVKAPSGQQITAACAFMMVLMMVVHSQLEYPLWYAYFLLPGAFAFGACLGVDAGEKPVSVKPVAATQLRPMVLVGVLVATGGAFSMLDYLRVTPIFQQDAVEALDRRIAKGQKSLFFAHHADYAAATIADHPSTQMKSFRRATHYLLDTRLMMAWSIAYAELGDFDRARYLAQRLREFRNPASEEFFAPCNEPGDAPKPYQCETPTRPLTYEDFQR